MGLKDWRMDFRSILQFTIETEVARRAINLHGRASRMSKQRHRVAVEVVDGGTFSEQGVLDDDYIR